MSAAAERALRTETAVKKLETSIHKLRSKVNVLRNQLSLDSDPETIVEVRELEREQEKMEAMLQTMQLQAALTRRPPKEELAPAAEPDADVEAETEDQLDGRRKLADACDEGDVDAARALLDAGAEVDGVVSRKLTKERIGFKQFEWAKELFQMAPLHIAAKSGRNACVAELISRNANVHAAMLPNFWTPLQMAVATNHVSTAKLLIEASAVVDSLHSVSPDLDADGHVPMETPLLCAVRRLGRDGLATQQYMDVDPMVALLLDAKAGPNLEDASSHETPLRAACLAAHTQTVRLLIEAGAFVNEQSPSTQRKQGTSALHICCMHPNRALCADQLLKAAADVNLRLIAPDADDAEWPCAARLIIAASPSPPRTGSIHRPHAPPLPSSCPARRPRPSSRP